MSDHMNMQDLTVKAFVQQPPAPGGREQKIQIDVVNIPTHDLNVAGELWNALQRVSAVQAAYIYRGDRIIASWDAHANYLVGIHDISDEDEYLYHSHLSETDQDQLKVEAQP